MQVRKVLLVEEFVSTQHQVTIKAAFKTCFRVSMESCLCQVLVAPDQSLVAVVRMEGTFAAACTSMHSLPMSVAYLKAVQHVL